MAYLMDVKPEPGTLHVLATNTKEAVFEWTGSAWSTPGTGWGTKPAMMVAMKWRYLRPATPDGN